MKASDLSLINSLSRPTLHPSGRRAVVSVTRPDLGADATLGQLWSIPITGHAAPRRLTRGYTDTAPQFSPDGRLIAFLRAEADSVAQLFLVDAVGGDPMQITDQLLGINEFCWSPDGATLAFVSRVPEPGRYGTVNGLTAAAEPPRRITTLKYRQNGVGYIIDRRAQVFVVAVPDVWAEPVVPSAPSVDGEAEQVVAVPQARQLTDFDADHSSIAFSPDGRTLAVTAARHSRRDSDLRSNVFLLDVDSGTQPVDATGKHGNYSMMNAPGALAFGPNGALFFLAQNVGRSGRDFVGKNTSLFVIDQTGAVPRRLTEPETVDLGETGSAVTPFDDHSVLVQNRTRGTVQLIKVDVGGQSETVSGNTPIEVTGVAAAGSTIVVSYADASTTGDVGVYNNGSLRRVTDFSARLRKQGTAHAREFTTPGPDGYSVHGWVVMPEGEGPHPVLLNIHGGPFAQYSVRLFDEAQVYADAGYAVLMCNPRGSAGYGQAHGRSIRRAMGSVDLQDVFAFLDGAVEQIPELDDARVGIMGGSYGGYLTAWAIAHDHRFTAAIVERGYLDPDAFVGTSDIGSFFSDEYTGVDPDSVKAQSPQAMVDTVSTPTLVMHSEDDLRCPLSQAERYYAALKRRGVDTELLIFPGENHELSRSGRPRHRLERFEAILDWWARHLPSDRNPVSGA